VVWCEQSTCPDFAIGSRIEATTTRTSWPRTNDPGDPVSVVAVANNATLHNSSPKIFNMQKFVFVVLALLAVGCFAAPAKPVWPSEFSATVGAHNLKHHERPNFFRWFYSTKLDKERIDGAIDMGGELFFVESIADFKTDVEKVVLRGRDSVFCNEKNITGSYLPKPNFDHFEYIGEGDIDYTVVNVWYAADHHDHLTIVYYEDKRDGTPVRMDVADRRTNQKEETIEYSFFEFDAAPQDPDLFKVEANINHLCKSS